MSLKKIIFGLAKQITEPLIERAPDRLFLSYSNVRLRLNRIPDRFGYSSLEQLFFVRDRTGMIVYVSDRNRLRLYLRGVSARIEALARSYSLLELDIPAGSVVIDCGANIGELGLFAGSKVKYVAVEPDPNALLALRLNQQRGNILSCALSNYCGKGVLELRSSRADSYLLAEGSEAFGRGIDRTFVEVITLDYLREIEQIQEVYLLKVEAEGYEPEVLQGGKLSLRWTRFVAIDCGPERDGVDTTVECFRLLQQAGFELVGSKTRSGRFLFENSEMISGRR